MLAFACGLSMRIRYIQPDILIYTAHTSIRKVIPPRALAFLFAIPQKYFSNYPISLPYSGYVHTTLGTDEFRGSVGASWSAGSYSGGGASYLYHGKSKIIPDNNSARKLGLSIRFPVSIFIQDSFPLCRIRDVLIVRPDLISIRVHTASLGLSVLAPVLALGF